MAAAADSSALAASTPTQEPGSLSQWALIRRQFGQHRLAVASLFLLVVLYVLAAGAEFFAPHSQDCLSIQTVANYPWLLMPVVWIVLTVLCFNFLGDGLRDAADPFGGK